MIGFLITKFALMGVPERFRRALALASTAIAVALLCGTLWTCWLSKHDGKVIEKHEAGVTKATATASASASAAATDAASGTKSKVEKTNDNARKAASGSDDPLKHGLDSLRN